MKNTILIILIIICDHLIVFAQKNIRYDLYVNDTTVNYTGKKVNAITVNEQIPGHVRLQFSWEDLALTNRLGLNTMWNTDLEYEIGLALYSIKKIVCFSRV